MLNLNNVPADQKNQRSEFSLIPKGTVVRAVMIVKQGDLEIPEFGTGAWFKRSQNTSAKWMEIEYTIIGGEYDRRKFWDRIFVDGDKIGPSGMPQAKEIGLRTLKSLVESARNIDPADMSPQAQQSRNITGMMDLNGMEICAKIGIKKGNNGYADQNSLMAALAPNSKEYLASAQDPVMQTPASVIQPNPTPPPQANGAVPAWAQR
tara:strand:- start:5926 stop:6543 length:618 start_codon:yes stop_codon:yes gene_type:complete